MGLVEQDILTKLSLLMRSGPACGISFLIISTTYISRQTAVGKEIELKVSSIAPNITVLEPDDISIKLLQKQAKDQAADHHKSSQGSSFRGQFHLSCLSTCSFNCSKPFSPLGLCTCLPPKGQPSPAWGALSHCPSVSLPP